MQTKRIQCPQCQAVLDVRNDEGLPEKKIFCPRCSSELLVKFKPKGDPVEAHTYYAQPRQSAADSAATQLGGGGQQRAAGGTAQGMGSVVRLVAGGISYPLSEGSNRVGRKSLKSVAEVQISTNDLTMSRYHVVITVTTSNGVKKVKLRNDQNKNPTFINGMQIANGDIVLLMDGNVILMGQTEVKVVI